MAVVKDAEQEYKPNKKKSTSDEKMVPGGLMKAVIRPGGGDAMPSDGDQVIYHCTVRTLDGWLSSKGTPIRQVLGKSKMILGLLEGIPTMLKGELQC
ncbi:putative peptidylprolyl isomerase [Helianthus annuus]|nr:putative peptidylprolyl isomerase [Helianthus annuus]